ncbi:MAG: sugar phosphate nucleotidyltransferase, partial [Candidatus Omnitrophota bacterium]|nr:sugar phosphate nucleotidyltransferase [Candidatus Omnitrophota bacterium]
MRDTIAIILAAGKGMRMKSACPKVLHDLLGRPVISYILDSIRQAGIRHAITISGHESALLAAAVKDTKILIQKELTGSASAVFTAKKFLGSYSGDVLVICGDTPLIKSETIKSLIKKHKGLKASLTILTARLKDPAGYGRIVRSHEGKISKITEEEEADIVEKAITEVNAGTYCFKAKDLFAAIVKVKSENKKKEFFLTDTVAIL